MTTTDDFAEAARAEGQARIAAMLEVSGASDDIRAWFPAGFEKGAEWARTHLAAQEPTEEEVLDLIEDRLYDAGVAGSAETSDGDLVTIVDATMDEVLTAACVALSAARAARRDEEKQ